MYYHLSCTYTIQWHNSMHVWIYTCAGISLFFFKFYVDFTDYNQLSFITKGSIHCIKHACIQLLNMGMEVPDKVYKCTNTLFLPCTADLVSVDSYIHSKFFLLFSLFIFGGFVLFIMFYLILFCLVLIFCTSRNGLNHLQLETKIKKINKQQQHGATG